MHFLFPFNFSLFSFIRMRFRRAKERGFTDIGWLKSWHSFSFGNYYDRSNMGFGALRVVNDDVIAPGAGFGSHAHDNMEIITIVLEGAVEHKDSMGVMSQIGAGEIQIMSAGTGVIHSEHNVSRTQPLTLFQIWIEPSEYHIKPQYEQRTFNLSVKNIWKPLVSSLGHDALSIHQDAAISIATLEKGKVLEYAPEIQGNGIFLMVISGSIEVDEEQLQERDAIEIVPMSPVKIKAHQEARVMCIEVPMI